MSAGRIAIQSLCAPQCGYAEMVCIIAYAEPKDSISGYFVEYKYHFVLLIFFSQTNLSFRCVSLTKKCIFFLIILTCNCRTGTWLPLSGF